MSLILQECKNTKALQINNNVNYSFIYVSETYQANSARLIHGILLCDCVMVAEARVIPRPIKRRRVLRERGSGINEVGSAQAKVLAENGMYNYYYIIITKETLAKQT